jgi:hypothetical protein
MKLLHNPPIPQIGSRFLATLGASSNPWVGKPGGESWLPTSWYMTLPRGVLLSCGHNYRYLSILKKTSA